ncbi:hypothetical protein V501_00174 [Pseudogymnoascus sp. VKM F-4519 (FW-2642)]|nr:hypothetical protein V501_00174 [Pseudogymnoascus sp. VKM F-4519 (FW-2642)]
MSATTTAHCASHPVGLKSNFKHPFKFLHEKLQPKINNVKVAFSHKRHELGKLGNTFNPNHRHDEKHEKITDDKRTRISSGHPFQSFAPERPGNDVKWYVDGRDYYWAVSIALERAKETIYIEDWWLSPELFMRRPPCFNQEWRLDQILKRRAEAGVKIYVIVYREVEAALTCNSKHTKQVLQGICPVGSKGYGNIVVMRHPDHNRFENAADRTLYWAHHEKFVVIDYHTAFIGGLDLCFGRWDTHQHPLVDVHLGGIFNEIWPGQDFNNNRVMDFQNVEEWKSNALSKAEYGRMPWHDVAMGVLGPCVVDIAEHFVLRWNLIKRDKYKRDGRYNWLIMEGRDGPDEDLIGVQRPNFPVGEYVSHPLSPLSSKALGNRGTVHAQVVRSSSDWSSGILTEHSIQNAYSEVIRNAQHYIYIENQFFITATGDKQAPIKNTIGKAIVEAVVRAGREGRKFRVIAVIPAIPGFTGDLRHGVAVGTRRGPEVGTRAIMNYQYQSICRGEQSIFEQIRAQGVDPAQHIFFFNLRSYDRLRATTALEPHGGKHGVKNREVQMAEAQQTTDSGIHSAGDQGGDLGRHIPNYGDYDEEQRTNAKRRHETAEEPVGSNRATERTQSVAKNAMYQMPKLEDELQGCNTIGEVDSWVQEELYIHAKLLIADDRTVICGSSNLNDRSQLGSRDSELSIVMTDTEPLESKMNGQEFVAGRHAATLRRYLWREHLGLLPPQDLDARREANAQPPGIPNDPHQGDTYEFVGDPLGNEVWHMWTSRATQNTNVFSELFHADPDNSVKTFKDYDKYLPAKGTKAGHVYDRTLPRKDILRKLDLVKGHLVWMPLEFLKDTPMSEPGIQFNSLTDYVYT